MANKNLFTAQIAPVNSTARGKAREAETITITLNATNYSSAVAAASGAAADRSAERGIEYGVIRVW
mgnify:CR=1 FL=1